MGLEEGLGSAAPTYNNAELVRELCRTALKLYRWDILFDGDFRSSGICIENIDWEELSLSYLVIGREIIDNTPTYGFVDESQKGRYHYVPFAKVYGGKIDNHQEDILHAMLLFMRRAFSSKPLSLTVPASLSLFLKPSDIYLLQPDNKEVKKRRMVGPSLIYRHGNQEDVSEIMDSFMKRTARMMDYEPQ